MRSFCQAPHSTERCKSTNFSANKQIIRKKSIHIQMIMRIFEEKIKESHRKQSC